MKTIINKFEKRDWIYLALSILIFSTLTLISINKFSIWHDEGYTATLIENNFIGIIERTALDVHPPLYYLFLKAWSLFFGDSILALRLFSLITMQGAILISWIIFRRLFGSSKARLTLVFMSLGPFMVRYGQEMRMYGLVALISSIATLIYIRSFNNKFTIKNQMLYGFVVALGIYTHYFFVLVPLVHFIHSLIFRKEINQNIPGIFKKYLYSLLVIIILFLPWIVVAVRQFINVQGAFWIEPVNLSTIINTPIFMLIYQYKNELLSINGAVSMLVLMLVVVLLRKYYLIYKNSSERLLLMLFVLPPVILFILSLPPLQPSYYDRYFSFLASFFYGTLALGAMAFNSKLNKYMVFVLTCALLYGQINQFMIGNDFEEKSRPYYTMKHIVKDIDDTSPIYATSLNTFFDARTTARDMDKAEVRLIQSEIPKSWEGNWSALYKREDLIVIEVPNSVENFWLIEESWSKETEFNGYTKKDKNISGYARLTRYTKNK